MFHRKDPKKSDAEVPYELDADAPVAPEAAAVQEPAAAPEEPETPAGEQAATLAELVTKLQAEKEELRQTLIRRQADFENYRKRIERESQAGGQRAVARLLEMLLPVFDGFERALAAHDDPAYEDYRKGFELIYRQLWDAAARQGLERIEGRGKPFDPHIQQAVERVESLDHADGTVLEVLQPGYKLGERLLRAASVRVAVHPGEQGPAAPSSETSRASKRVN